MNEEGTNQYSKGGIAAEFSKDRQRAEMLCQLLYSYAVQEPMPDGNRPDFDQGRLAAAKILIDKGKPSLSTVDYTVTLGEGDIGDPQAFKARLAMLIEKAGPALLSEILGERAKQLPVTIEQKQVEVGDAEHIDPQKQRNTGS